MDLSKFKLAEKYSLEPSPKKSFWTIWLQETPPGGGSLLGGFQTKNSEEEEPLRENNPSFLKPEEQPQFPQKIGAVL